MGKLHLITGNYITNAKDMDAIVDAQNKYMGPGGGICGVVLQAAGRKELLAYCKDTYKENMYTGEVRITPGFNLDMDIIHVLAPIYKEQKNPIEALKNVYLNLVESIKENNYKKVLLCSLGTGIYGYNPEEVAYDVINILNDFTKNNDVEIYFNNMYPVYENVFLKEYIKINNIDLSLIKNMSDAEILTFLEKNNLIDLDIEDKFNNFIIGKDLLNFSLAEKLIYLIYVLKTKEHYELKNVIIDSII